VKRSLSHTGSAMVVMGLLALFLGACGSSGGKGPGPTPAGPAEHGVSLVKQVFTAAMQASMAMLVPTGATQPMAAGQQASPPPASAVAQQQTAGQADIAKYFSGAAAQLQANSLNAAINNETKPTLHVLGCGVSKVVFKKVALSDSQATVKADVTSWARYQNRHSDGTWTESQPTNVTNYTAHLVEDSAGNWTVSSLVSDFAPGSAP
jgi:hypothetical protein